jgi:hypothetical protein
VPIAAACPKSLRRSRTLLQVEHRPPAATSMPWPRMLLRHTAHHH